MIGLGHKFSYKVGKKNTFLRKMILVDHEKLYPYMFSVAYLMGM